MYECMNVCMYACLTVCLTVCTVGMDGGGDGVYSVEYRRTRFYENYGLWKNTWKSHLSFFEIALLFCDNL